MTTEWLNVSDVTPRIAYTATASQTAFVVPFLFFEDEDLFVYQNTILLTLGTDYTVSGAEDEDGGSITLLTGATVGDEVMIVRKLVIEQTTHIPPSGPLDIPAVNVQISKLIAIDQQLDDKLERSIHFPESDSTTSGELASVTNRKNKLLGFGTDGEITYPLGPDFVGDTATGAATIDSRATAQVTTFDVSVNIIRTAGYTSPGDGGEAFHKRSAIQPSHPGKFQSADGVWWELIARTPTPAMFGGDPTGSTGSSTAITDAISYVVSKWGKGFIDCRGKWKLDTGTITVTSSDVVLGGVVGWGTAEFIRGHDAGPLFSFQSPTPSSAYSNRSGLVNAFIYDLSALGTFANSPYGLIFDLVNYPYFDNVKVTDECVAFRACANIFGSNIQVYHGGKTYAAGRKVLYFGSSALSSPFINYGGAVFLTNIDVTAGTISGTTVQPKADDAIYIANCDGVNLVNCHAIFSAFANLHIQRTNAATPCDNIELVNTYLDMGSGYGFRLDGTQICHNIKFDGTVSQIGLGTAAIPGVSIAGPCDRVTLDINVEGMKGHGIHVNHASVSRLTIRPGHIYNIDSDDNGDGDGIYIQSCASASVVGGLIGGDGTMQSGIHIGSSASDVMISGVRVSDCDAWGCIIDSGATDLTIIGNDFAGNTLGALSDATATSVPKLIKANRGTVLYGSQSQVVGSIANGVSGLWNVTVAGAALGDFCHVSFDKDLGGSVTSAQVVGADTVKVAILNVSGGALNYGTVTATVEVEKRYSA
jgi:hypothetical protein